MNKLLGFDEHAEYGLELLGQAGMAVSVVQNDEIIFARGFGLRDIEQGIKADEKTIFPIGSSTKSFTAAAVMLLQERGLVDIDKPLCEYLPELIFKDDMATLLATPRDLLCHRTGLPRHDLIWVLRPYISRKELPLAIRNLDASKPFRAEHQYNNLMFACLGRMIEKIDGRTWEEFVGQEFFKPLDMNTACFTLDDAIVNGNFSLAYESERKTGELNAVPYIRLGGMAPAGAINANVIDLANWMRFNLSGGAFGGKQIVKKELIEMMQKPNMPTPESPFTVSEEYPGSYGLGWEIDSFRGRRLIYHGGNVAGSSAMVAFMPEIDAGISIVVNTGSSMLTYAMMYDAFDRLMGYGGQKDWPEHMKNKLSKLYEDIDKQRNENEEEFRPVKTKRKPKEFTGIYKNAAYGVLKIYLDEEGRLILRSTEYTMPLKNQHYDIFSTNLVLPYQAMPLKISFETGVDGGITSLNITLEAAVEPIKFNKTK